MVRSARPATLALNGNGGNNNHSSVTTVTTSTTRGRPQLAAAGKGTADLPVEAGGEGGQPTTPNLGVEGLSDASLDDGSGPTGGVDDWIFVIFFSFFFLPREVFH